MTDKIAQVGIFTVSVSGYVALALQGQATAEYVTLVGPVLAAVFVINHLNRRSDQQDQVLSKIQENTNGVLDRRIHDAVARALNDRSET